MGIADRRALDLSFLQICRNIKSSHFAYTAVPSVPSIRSNPIPAQPSSGTGSGARGELEKYEVQLAGWIHCPSSKTSAGKAKIAEIAGKISEIKAEIKKVDDVKAAAKGADEKSLEKQSSPKMRIDGLGTRVSVQA